MKRYIRSNEIDEWNPFSGGRYRISGGYDDMEVTDDPKKAIKTWFRFNKKDPTNVAIFTDTKSNALDLLEVATPEYLTKLHDQFGCPYKLDYLINEVQNKIDDGCKWFHEGYMGDSIHPFSVG